MLSDKKSSCHHFRYVYRRYSVRILPGTENSHDCNQFQLDVSQGYQQFLAHFDAKAWDVTQLNHHSLTQELPSTIANYCIHTYKKNSSLRIFKHSAMKTYGRLEI